MHITPIRGAYYRPPATGILRGLPAGYALELRPESSNAYDPHAVAVWTTIDADDLDALNATVRQKLADEIAGFGSGLEDLARQREWHLGYVPASESAAISTTLAGAPCAARLTFAQGAPAVAWEPPPPPEFVA